MDSKDYKILDLVQKNGKLSYAHIGKKVSLSVSAVNERMKKLLADGIIDKNVYIVNASSIGLNICAFIQLVTPNPLDEPNFKNEINKIPQVLECHSITGEFSYLLKVRVKNTIELEKLISDKLKSIKGVSKSKSMITLTTSKETTYIQPK